jgi:hypothetical protein
VVAASATGRSYISAYFRVKRHPDNIMSTYMTNCLFGVVFAYLNFWISKQAVPARVSLGIFTAVFALSNEVSLTDKLPVLGYRVWLLDFLTYSFYFVSSVLIMYAMVNWGTQCEAWCLAADRKEAKARASTSKGSVKQLTKTNSAVYEARNRAMVKPAGGQQPTKTDSVTPAGDQKPELAKAASWRKTRAGVVKAASTLFTEGVEVIPKHFQSWEYTVKKQCEKLQRLDQIFRYLFPLFYAIFFCVMFSLIDVYQNEADKARGARSS